MARRDSCDSMAHLKAPLVIVGGGLAGLSLAAGLRNRGVAVSVHEAGHYPRHRVCGEFISGVERSTLETLGIAEAFDDAHLHRSVVWFHGDQRIHENLLPTAAYGISRHRLDLRLVQLVERLGGEVLQGVRQPREPDEGKVWAAGRIAGESPWIGLKAHFLDLPMLADLEMHVGSNGYVGLAGVEDGRVNVCGLFRLDRERSGKGSALQLDYLRAGGLGALADRLSLAMPDEVSFKGVSALQLGWQEPEPGLFSIGDAAAMIPPFTGNGMSMAFQSAESALDPLTAWSAGECSWPEAVSALETSLRQRFSRRLGTANLLQGLLGHPLGRGLMNGLGRSGLLPFRSLLSLVRQ